MTPQIENSVIAAIARHKRLDPVHIRLDSPLTELGVTSLEAITIVYEIEEEFDVEVPNSALEGLQTVGDIIERMHRLLEVGR